MITIDHSKCNKDLLCIKECAYGFMYTKDENGYPVIQPSLFEKYCIHCWHCIAICPKGAMSSPGVTQKDLEQSRRDDVLSYDQLGQVIRSRRSFRTFKDASVPDDIIAQWLDMTRWAPTASNSQRLKWILVQDRQKVEHLASILIEWLKEKQSSPEIIQQWNQGHDIVLRHAPHLVMVTVPADYFWASTDAATAISYLELTASSLGMGTCWAGYFTRAASEYAPLRHALQLSENQNVGGALMFGYPVYRFSHIPTRNTVTIQYI